MGKKKTTLVFDMKVGSGWLFSQYMDGNLSILLIDAYNWLHGRHCF